MSGQKKIYLLPCGACRHEIDVVAGQAGGEVVCPACGGQNDVPKFRDLGQLRIKAESSAPSSRWGVLQAVALAGIAWAALSWGTAAWVGAVPKAALDADWIRANIDAGDDKALYESLENYSRSSVERLPLNGEVALQRQTRFAQGMSRTLYALGGLGALAAAGAGLASLARAKRA